MAILDKVVKEDHSEDLNDKIILHRFLVFFVFVSFSLFLFCLVCVAGVRGIPWAS